MYIFFIKVLSPNSKPTLLHLALWWCGWYWANHNPSLLLVPRQVLPIGRVREKLEGGRLAKGIALSFLIIPSVAFYQELYEQGSSWFLYQLVLNSILFPYSQNETYALFPEGCRCQLFGAFPWALKAPAIGPEDPSSEF